MGDDWEGKFDFKNDKNFFHVFYQSMKLNTFYDEKVLSKKLSNCSSLNKKNKPDLFTNTNADLFVNKILMVKIPDGMTVEEYQQIHSNAIDKTINIMECCLFTSVFLLFAGMSVFKSGKFDKQVNKILSSDNKFIETLRESINSKVRRQLNDKLDFSNAKSHFHNIGAKNGKVSGAHEIKECIQTLINEKGNICDIKQSKTQNGLWEILYEINGEIADASKTVYISKPLTDNDAKDLFSLSKKHFSKKLLKSINKIVDEKTICDVPEMESSIETALREGFIIRTKGLENSTSEARNNLSSLIYRLKLKTIDYNFAEQKLHQLKAELKELKKVFVPTSDEFQSKVSEITSAKQLSKQLRSECDSLESSISKAKEHYNHVKDSVNIFGEKDGKLFAAYAHFDNNKVVVDSYFPIAHGSGLQKEFVECCLNSSVLSLNNIKCLIGAKESQINRFFLQLGKKFTKWFKSNFPKVAQGASIGIVAGSEVIVASDIKKSKKETKNI